MSTLMIQDMLADPEWADILTDEDKRALNPTDKPAKPRSRVTSTPTSTTSSGRTSVTFSVSPVSHLAE
ncbi:hypothetical protein ACFVW1_14450 [Streptomyces olivochromogenes]|uniref:hypothetical protein n=1 Tax=Streptomyces olivochromogenes TaxID=1963 RepID=UPI0036DCB0E1